jgi:hypothetical protein
VLESLRTTRGRVGIAVLMSLVLVVVSMVFEFPIAIVPALLVPFWIPVFAQEEPVSPPARRLMLVLLAGGLAMLAGVGALIFVVART